MYTFFWATLQYGSVSLFLPQLCGVQSIISSHVACPAVPCFSTLSHKRHDFRKECTEHEICVLIFSTDLSETFLIPRRTERNIGRKCKQLFMCSARNYCQILMDLEISRKIFEKSSNIKFHENPSSGRRVVACGRTDGHRDRQTDVMKLTVAFRNFANMPKRFNFCVFS